MARGISGQAGHEHIRSGRSAGSIQQIGHEKLELFELDGPLDVAVGETVILLQPPLPLVGVSMWMERGRQQNDSLADGYLEVGIAEGLEELGEVTGLIRLVEPEFEHHRLDLGGGEGGGTIAQSNEQAGLAARAQWWAIGAAGEGGRPGRTSGRLSAPSPSLS